ncbi:MULTISPECIES: PAS domain S-box protein [Calothrix]|uniref:PAS domain S-box protein n=2 Tax=Calothrix TaxID=1186 RepID=A0ABR8AMS1_9CYAN|nr:MULTISPECIES: PAS domain S-box protein [Calothrix]MBD2200850.1 PAS domain S-box protein [Calothrix parietina FACHB-288]MBD2229883.1 PAS domain S-box protein [Calothrix anomala FACHB-343]
MNNLLSHTQENHIRERKSLAVNDSKKYGVIIFDYQLQIKHINQQALTMIGWNLHEAQGKIFTEIMQVVEQQTLLNLENKIISTIKEKATLYFHKGILLIAKNGNMIPIANSINSFKNDQGELTGGVIVFWEER